MSHATAAWYSDNAGLSIADTSQQFQYQGDSLQNMCYLTLCLPERGILRRRRLRTSYPTPL